MLLDPLGAIAQVIVGFHGTSADVKQKDAWFRFGASLFATCFCTFWFSWGSATWALFKVWGLWPSLVLGFATGCITMAVVAYQFWLRSPLTKGMGIMVPSDLAAKGQETNTTYTEKT